MEMRESDPTVMLGIVLLMLLAFGFGALTVLFVLRLAGLL